MAGQPKGYKNNRKGGEKFSEGFSSKLRFDADCRLKKQEPRDSMRRYGRGSQKYRDQNKAFISLCKEKKRSFEHKQTAQLKYLRTRSPKEYWKLLRKGFGENKGGSEITCEEWFEYFRILSQKGTEANENEDSIQEEEEEEETLLSQFLDHVQNELLERPITIHEVSERIRYGLRFHMVRRAGSMESEMRF